jgi:hypothetical protein
LLTSHHLPVFSHAGNSVIERAGNGRGGGGGHNGGSSGPNSWQFYAPVRQLLADKPAAAPQKPATQAEAAPKQTAMKPAAAPQKPANKPEAAPKQTAMKPTQAPQATKKLEAAPKQQQGQQQAAPAQAPKVQPERGFRGWGWAGNSDMAGMPGGGNAYPLMNNRNVSDRCPVSCPASCPPPAAACIYFLCMLGIL